MNAKRKRRNKAGKGSQFEREVCTDLSLWWTGGRDDGVFWRSSSSGARAKTRGRKGKFTFGQSGDVAAVDPIGNPLIDLFTIEVKRGYQSSSLMELIDLPGGSAVNGYEEWFAQALESHEQSGSASWLILYRRNRREAVVILEERIFLALVPIGSHDDPNLRIVHARIPIRYKGKETRISVIAIPFWQFLFLTTPERVRKAAESF